MSNNEQTHTINDLHQMQSLPLDVKIKMTKRRIQEWYDNFDGNVYVSFSGGKDSTALLHMAREVEPNIKAVFFNTGIEFPSVVKFVREMPDIEEYNTQHTFVQIVKKFGYPLLSKDIAKDVYSAKSYINKRFNELSKAIGGGTSMLDLAYEAAKQSIYCSKFFGCYRSKAEYINGENPRTPTTSLFNKKRYLFMLEAPFNVSHYCCHYLKEHLAHDYFKQNGAYPITGVMANESKVRTNVWLRSGCNLYNAKDPISNPMSFWTEQDVLEYLYINNIQIASCYGDIINVEGEYQTIGMHRLGCFPCGFGIHLEKESRLQKMIDIGNENLTDWILRGGAFDETDGMWKPKGGLGLAFPIMYINTYGGFSIYIPNEEEYYASLPDKAKELLEVK